MNNYAKLKEIFGAVLKIGHNLEIQPENGSSDLDFLETRNFCNTLIIINND